MFPDLFPMMSVELRLLRARKKSFVVLVRSSSIINDLSRDFSLCVVAVEKRIQRLESSSKNKLSKNDYQLLMYGYICCSEFDKSASVLRSACCPDFQYNVPQSR